MEKTVPELIAAITPEEWNQVPESVLKLINELVGRMDKLEQEMGQLRTENELLKEQVARNSANSSQPPSKNPLTFTALPAVTRYTFLSLTQLLNSFQDLDCTS